MKKNKKKTILFDSVQTTVTRVSAVPVTETTVMVTIIAPVTLCKEQSPLHSSVKGFALTP